jgi:hypothetical protein
MQLLSSKIHPRAVVAVAVDRDDPAPSAVANQPATSVMVRGTCFSAMSKTIACGSAVRQARSWESRGRGVIF